MKKILVLCLIILLVFSLTACSSGSASNEKPQNDSKSAEGNKNEVSFPEKDLKIIVPFDPGGAVDVTCRIISELAPDYLNGKKIIVENMPGGGAVVGQTHVSKANPDGYTILAYTSSVVSNPMTKTTTYTHESFQPVAMYCFDPDVLIVSADSKFKTLQEFLDYSKENEVSINIAGIATAHHIAGMILQNQLGAKFNFIHTTGAGMQIQQILGGHVDAGLLTTGEAQGQIMDGTIRALGLMHDVRRQDFPEVPTFRENGVDILYGAWRGLAVPKDTPKEVVDILAKAFEGIIADQRFIDKMTKAGYPIIFRGPQEFTEYVDMEAKNFKEVLPLLQEAQK